MRLIINKSRIINHLILLNYGGSLESELQAYTYPNWFVSTGEDYNKPHFFYMDSDENMVIRC